MRRAPAAKPDPYHPDHTRAVSAGLHAAPAAPRTNDLHHWGRHDATETQHDDAGIDLRGHRLCHLRQRRLRRQRTRQWRAGPDTAAKPDPDDRPEREKQEEEREAEGATA